MSNQPTPTPTLLLKPREAAKVLSISERKLWSLTQPRGPIPAVRHNRWVAYHLVDLESWIESAKGGTTCQA